MLRRVGRVAATGLATATMVLALGSCSPLHASQRANYCAIMPDHVGLYVGNPVTHMGYRIGTIDAITTTLNDVRVDFNVARSRRLPRNAKAIIRSTSVLADRSLELVGRAKTGPALRVGECIPLSRSFTPKSLSEMIGSATQFIKSINPEGSTNIGDAVRGIDQAIRNNGPDINRLLTTTSAVLDSPDQAVNDIGSVITNLAQLTSLITELRGPVKQILLEMQGTMPDVARATKISTEFIGTTMMLVKAAADVEVTLGETTQFTLDAVSMAVRKLSAHARRLANLLNVAPWWINSLANIANTHGLNFLRYRPPLYRIRTPNGVALCNILNAKTPGSCANVQGTPYAVDVSLLQYVLMQAAGR